MLGAAKGSHIIENLVSDATVGAVGVMVDSACRNSCSELPVVLVKLNSWGARNAVCATIVLTWCCLHYY